MRKIYKVSLNIISIMLVFLLLIACSYTKYLKSMKEEVALVLVDNGLSVNYLDGDYINTTGEQRDYRISVTNNSDGTLYYYIETDNISKNKENLRYNLVEENKKIDLLEDNYPDNNEYLVNAVEIEPFTTHTYVLTILENSGSSLKANIKVGLDDRKEKDFASTILEDNEIKSVAATKIGEEVATDNEGLIKLEDDEGTSYYFRGNIPNNYVNFANLTWRIVKINGNGTIKLILNDYIEEKTNYYEENSEKLLEEKLDFLKTNISKTLDNWYKYNLGDYEKYITTAKYCVDDSVGQSDGVNNYYLAYSRLLTDYSQVNNCLGSQYSSKIALLTADEAVYAGASKNSINSQYYLYTPGKDFSWWTMTPASSNGNNITYFEIDASGMLKNESTGNFYRGVKPVINLNKKIFVSGKGTIDNPYIVKE